VYNSHPIREENGTGMPNKMFKYPGADGVRNYTGMPDPEYYESQNSESRVL
jgi:hypothetical protein